jgi:hypothetical protein
LDFTPGGTRVGDGRAEHQQQHQPVLERDIGGQRKEIEADVLAKHRIALAIRHLVEEAKHDVPVRKLEDGDQQAEKDGHAGDEEAPRHVRRCLTEKLERGLRPLPGQGPRRRRARRPDRRPPGEAERQPSRKPERTGRGGEDREEETARVVKIVQKTPR